MRDVQAAATRDLRHGKLTVKLKALCTKLIKAYVRGACSTP